MSSLTQFKCPSCGSSLEFNPEKGKLVCPSCGNEYEVEAMEAFNKQEEDPGANGGFDWGAYKSDKDSFATLDDMNIYVCNSCGATIEADKNTAASACPYCGNNVIMDNNLSGSLKPNAIIPFKIKPKDLPGIIKKFCKNKHLIPGGFFEENKIGKLQGVYVPFWLFDCHVDGEATFNATRVRHYRQGQYDCTDTAYFLLDREGEVTFQKIPVDASVRMDDDLMDSVEPFNYADLVDFDKAYLSGYLAERFDTDPDVEFNRASARMRTTTVSALTRTATGYTTVTPRANNMRMDNAAVKYTLLPVYLLNCTYRGKNYRYAINGQTGKVVGELPVSGKKKLAYFFGVMAPVAAAVFLIMQFLM